jgi:hypothetical protein
MGVIISSSCNSQQILIIRLPALHSLKSSMLHQWETRKDGWIALATQDQQKSRKNKGKQLQLCRCANA